MAAEGDACALPVREMDIRTTLQQVLQTALAHRRLVRGLRQVVKALENRQARLCVLSSSVDELGYVRLVEALCADLQVILLKGAVDSKTLGQWSGLCNVDKKDGKTVRKVVGCGCVVVKDCGAEKCRALDALLEHLKSKIPADSKSWPSESSSEYAAVIWA